MLDYLESLERLAMPDELHVKECEKLGIGVTEDFDIVERALLELKAIKEVNPSEAMECLENLFSNVVSTAYTRESSLKDFNTIKNYILKAQALEKEKIIFKHIHNTKVKTPLVSIFNGLNQEERHKFIEHIYYNWEEMKEALEDKNEELVKENTELKKELNKKYLKWEYLEFKHKPVFTEAKMGETIYKLVIGFDCTGKETIFLRTDNQQIVFHEKDVQFFNDLHLERVEK